MKLVIVYTLKIVGRISFWSEPMNYNLQFNEVQIWPSSAVSKMVKNWHMI